MEYLFAEEFEFILTSLLPISNRTTFFQYRSMSGGRFLVSLTEVSTSEKKLACRSLLEEEDNYWMQEEPEHPGEADYVDAFVQKLELDESATMEALLCGNSKFMAFITKRNCQEIWNWKLYANYALFRWPPIMNILCPERKSTMIEALSRDG